MNWSQRERPPHFGPRETPVRGHTCGPTSHLEEQRQELANSKNKIKSLSLCTQKAEAFKFYSHNKMEQQLLPSRHLPWNPKQTDHQYPVCIKESAGLTPLPPQPHARPPASVALPHREATEGTALPWDPKTLSLAWKSCGRTSLHSFST